MDRNWSRAFSSVRFAGAYILVGALLLAVRNFPNEQSVGARAKAGLVAAGVFPRAKCVYHNAAAPLVGATPPAPPLFAFFLPLGHDPVPIDAAGLRSVGEVARAAVTELALPAKLGHAVTAADVRLFIISHEEGLRLIADSARIVPEAEKGAPLGAIDTFDIAELCEGSCLLVELQVLPSFTDRPAPLLPSPAVRSIDAEQMPVKSVPQSSTDCSLWRNGEILPGDLVENRVLRRGVPSVKIISAASSTWYADHMEMEMREDDYGLRRFGVFPLNTIHTILDIGANVGFFSLYAASVPLFTPLSRSRIILGASSGTSVPTAFRTVSLHTRSGFLTMRKLSKFRTIRTILEGRALGQLASLSPLQFFLSLILSRLLAWRFPSTC